MTRPLLFLVLVLMVHAPSGVGGTTKEPIHANPAPEGKVLIDDLGCLDCHTLEGIFGRVDGNSDYSHRRIRLNLYNSFPVRKYRLAAGEAQRITDYLQGVRREVADSVERIQEELNNVEDSERLNRQGREVYDRLGCGSCHKIAGEGFDKGPDLTEAGSRLKPGWMYVWMKHPNYFFPNTSMPSYSYTEDQLLALVAFLAGLKGDLPHLPYTEEKGDPSWIRRGKEWVQTLGCKRCHPIDGKGGAFAPDLSYTGDKFRKEWLHRFLKDPYPIRPEGAVPGTVIEIPSGENPIVRMPYQYLSNDQLRGLVEYLSSRTFAGPGE